MKLQTKLAVALGALTLATAPAMVLADPPATHGHGNGAANGKGPQYHPAPETPGPGAGLPEKAKAYGVYCQGYSKKHVKGQKGTRSPAAWLRRQSCARTSRSERSGLVADGAEHP